MSEPPAVIHTERLDLVPLTVAHAAEMADVLGDRELHEFIGGEPLGAGALQARYERLVAGASDPGVLWLNWVMLARAEGRLVGTVQATIETGPAGTVAEIAWVVGRRWQGTGFAKEAATALVAHLRDLRVPTGEGVTTVVAHVHPDHHASGAVAAAAGLVPTDRIDDGEVRWELAW